MGRVARPVSVKADLDAIANKIALPMAKATVYAACVIYVLLSAMGMLATIWAVWKVALFICKLAKI